MPKMLGVAVAWMRKEDWPRWLAIDPDFQPDYDRWIRRMTAEIERLQDQGTLVEKVVIDPDMFVEWCRTNRCAVDSKNRATYAAQVLAKRHRAGH